MKIIIIGAGIAGLTFANACHRAGIEVKLYEKAKALENIGGGILLWPHGRRYLTWLGLAESLKPFQVPVKRCRIVGQHGKEIFREEYADFYSLLGGEILPIDRNLLQMTLLAQLPPSLLQLGKECVEIKENPDTAYVKFADGTEETADLVVGADGIFSTVRSHLHADVLLHYTNYCWWGGIMQNQQVPALSADEVYIAVGQSKMCIFWPILGERFMWYMPIKMDINHFVETEISPLPYIGNHWNNDLQPAINMPALTSEKNFYLPILALPPQMTWSTNRVVLIGDAAHALGPILGQGASQAIEDAFVLIKCLQQAEENLPAALQYYETLRRPRYEQLSQLENQAAATMISDEREAVELFQNQLEQMDLVTMYQDLIPLIDEKACLQVAKLASAVPCSVDLDAPWWQPLDQLA